jgi:BTB/POZ domain-containing protein
MAGFIKLAFPFRYRNLKTEFDLTTELLRPVTFLNQYLYAGTVAAQCDYARGLNTWIKKVVGSVKETILKTDLRTCEISLVPDPSSTTSTSQLPSPDLSLGLITVAQALYRIYGIGIKQVDALPSPRKLVVSWHRDHPTFFTTYLAKTKVVDCSTCTLKFKGKSFLVPTNILAARSSVFEGMFKSGMKEAVIDFPFDDLDEPSFQMLINYFYTGELNLPDGAVDKIAQFLELADYYDLPHLQHLCFEHLCHHVNGNNFETFIEFARDSKELEGALVEHFKHEITAETVERFIVLAISLESEALENACLAFLPPLFIGTFHVDTIELEESHMHNSLPASQLEPSRVTVDYFEKANPNFSQLPYRCPQICRMTRTLPLMRLLQLGVKCQWVKIVELCAGYMSAVSATPPGLNCILDCLVISYHYASKLTWWPESRPNPLQELKLRLLKVKISLDNVKTILLMAMDEKIEELQKPCLDLVIGQVQKLGKETTLFGRGSFDDFAHLLKFVSQCTSPQFFLETMKQMDDIYFKKCDSFTFSHLLLCLHVLCQHSDWKWLPPDFQLLRRQMIEKLNWLVVQVIKPAQQGRLISATQQCLNNTDFADPFTSFVVIKADHLAKLLDLAIACQSQNILDDCMEDALQKSSNEGYKGDIIKLLDCLMISHYYSLPSQWLPQEKKTVMQGIKEVAIHHLVTHILPENVWFFWEIAGRHKIAEISNACLMILIPEVKKVNRYHRSVWGRGDLFDYQRLIEFIRIGKSKELAQAMIDHMKTDGLRNHILNYDYEFDLKQADWLLKMAFSDPTKELDLWPENFQELLQIFKENAIESIALTIEVSRFLCSFNNGKFLDMCLTHAKKHKIQTIKGKAIVALINTIKDYAGDAGYQYGGNHVEAFTQKHKKAPPTLLQFIKYCLFNNETYLDHSPQLQEVCEEALIKQIPENREKVIVLAKVFNLSAVTKALE